MRVNQSTRFASCLCHLLSLAKLLRFIRICKSELEAITDAHQQRIALDCAELGAVQGEVSLNIDFLHIKIDIGICTHLHVEARLQDAAEIAAVYRSSSARNAIERSEIHARKSGVIEAGADIGAKTPIPP